MSSPTYSAISSSSRVRILHLLQRRNARTVDELRVATGLHANTVREHLQRLVDGGYVVTEREQRTVRGRPRVFYAAATGADGKTSAVARRKAQQAASRGDLLRRVMPELGTTLDDRIIHQVDALVEDLESAGFAPLLDEDSLTVHLSPCPHATASPAERSVACAVHRALMDGVLAAAGGPLRAECIRSSSSAEGCLVQLTADAGSGGPMTEADQPPMAFMPRGG